MSILQTVSSDRTLVMGILNVTPDSFSDGGEHATVETAVAHAQKMLADGADIIDVGGESTRPGATRVSVAEEQRRILPVIERLAQQGVVMSVDTLNAETARAAIAAGAHIINDVSGMNLTDDMIAAAAELDVPYILMHARGNSQTMDAAATYANTVDEVIAELKFLIERLKRGGVREENIILDPGLGFAKTGAQDWELIAGLDRLQALGYPVLVAGSRKRFVANLLRNEDRRRSETEPELRDAAGRDAATAAISTISALGGAWAVRVHDVASTADSIAVASAVKTAGAR
ncbi:dihydropteroate synthase [Rothia sp. LK2588]|uniref:dihydropteroate synthase n=1 Tax=Rothia sp. LK2588 TaxID=3114369 RepID=UPI0034CFEE8E